MQADFETARDGCEPSIEAPIRIAAALIDDGKGRMLLVRKRGTDAFMQPGGKIGDGETALEALSRELREEIGLEAEEEAVRYLGRFSAPAANEAGREVVAELFHLRTRHEPIASMEIEEARWIDLGAMNKHCLAPLTRDQVVPIARSLTADLP